MEIYKGIKKIKIFGERNSGTNFLRQLINNNIIKVELCSDFYKDKTGWKHGYPKLNFSEMDDTLFIFIIRDLEPWLKSMFKKPYHLKKVKGINNFIRKKLKSKDERKDHNVNIDKDETNLTIFELRYKKINSYLNTFNNVKNAIIINLEDIQKDYGEKFINTIASEYKLLKTNEFKPILTHTKTKKNEQNKKIDLFINSDILNKKKNKKIEDIVDNLKNKYKIKSYLYSNS